MELLRTQMIDGIHEPHSRSRWNDHGDTGLKGGMGTLAQRHSAIVQHVFPTWQTPLTHERSTSSLTSEGVPSGNAYLGSP
jgi:hypothetical protein